MCVQIAAFRFISYFKFSATQTTTVTTTEATSTVSTGSIWFRTIIYIYIYITKGYHPISRVIQIQIQYLLWVCSFTANISYIKQRLASGCCISRSSSFHQRCHCEADTSFCKSACDGDEYCKGYVHAWGSGYCQIATTSSCPTSNSCQQHDAGNAGPLNSSMTCGEGYRGCYIKQSSKLII